MSVVKIIPGPNVAGSPAHLTNGTRVVLPNGSDIPGITKITLVAELDNVWRATIELFCEAPDQLLAETHDVTTLADRARRKMAGPVLLGVFAASQVRPGLDWYVVFEAWEHTSLRRGDRVQLVTVNDEGYLLREDGSLHFLQDKNDLYVHLVRAKS